MSATTQISAQQETWTSSSVSKPHGGGACRKGNYTVREKECFLEIMEDYAHIIEARGNSAESRWQKEQAWETISIRYNACIGIENLRDRTQLGILWKNLKARCKHEMATAVDPNTIAPPDPIGLKVSSLVRRGKNGEQSVSPGGSDDLIDSATAVSKQNFISTLIGGATIKTEPNSSDNEDESGDGHDDASDNPTSEESIGNRKHLRKSPPSATVGESRKRKRTPDRIVVRLPVKIERRDDLDELSSSPIDTEQSEVECYPKGVVVVQPTAVDDEPDAPASRVTHREEISAVPPSLISPSSVLANNVSVRSQNKRIIFSINPKNPAKKQPVPILPKITSVHSGVHSIAGIALAKVPSNPNEIIIGTTTNTITTNHNYIKNNHNRHISNSIPLVLQNATRPLRAPPRQDTPPMTSTRQNNSGGLAGESLSIQERQQQEEHDAKMELSRVQIELATAQLRMAEDEHRIRYAKLQIELQMSQMEHDAKAQQLS